MSHRGVARGVALARAEEFTSRSVDEEHPSFDGINSPVGDYYCVAPRLREISVRIASRPASASTRMTTTPCAMSCEPGDSCMICISVNHVTAFAVFDAQNCVERSRLRSVSHNPRLLALDAMRAALAVLWPLPRATEVAVRKNAQLQPADLPWQLRESPP